LNVFYMLDDFTEENGGTRIIPFSHKPENGVSPTNIFSQEGTIAAAAPAGTAFVFDSRLWHGTGPNVTNMKRHAIAMIFARYWVRPIENWSLQIPPSTFELMTERQRALCGFRGAYAMGGVEGVQHGKMVRWAPENLIPEMRRP
jgi:ectoine hydroxylase-related dioxygenase (phytanoyl-CoA dioxygenase family)